MDPSLSVLWSRFNFDWLHFWRPAPVRLREKQIFYTNLKKKIKFWKIKEYNYTFLKVYLFFLSICVTINSATSEPLNHIATGRSCLLFTGSVSSSSKRVRLRLHNTILGVHSALCVPNNYLLFQFNKTNAFYIHPYRYLSNFDVSCWDC